MKGHEKGGIKGSKKGIKHSFAGRHLHETEHHTRMGHELGEHDGYPSHEGAGHGNGASSLEHRKNANAYGDGSHESGETY